MTSTVVPEYELVWVKIVSRCFRDPVSGCLIWTGARGPNKYGHVWFARRYWYAHRLSWFVHFGQIPDGLQVHHSCDNPSCVNPAHLWTGTQKDNIRDCINKGRQSIHFENFPPRGELHARSLLSNSQVLEIVRRFKSGETTLALAREFGINRNRIYVWKRRVATRGY